MDDVTSDAFEVLELARAKAGVEDPYVFVGWSLGGSVALANALARPDQTVGLALIDSGLPEDFMKNCAADGRTRADCQAEFDSDIDAKFFETEIANATHPLDLPAVFVTAMEYPECVDAPAATQSANLGVTTVVAGDCAGLAVVIADHTIAAWKTVLPEIEETRLEANHNDMIRSDGRQIAELILGIVEETRASG
jgi:pimeloyl-ACP methyl ester carboxylesterase